MLPFKPLFVIILLIGPIFINAQDLILVKGNRTKEITVGKIISFQTSNSEGTFDKRNYASFRGELASVEDDSISLILFNDINLIYDGKKLRESRISHYKADSTRLKISYAKSTIKKLSVWGNNEQAIKNRQIWERIGAFVVGIGLITPLFAGSEDEDVPQGVKIAAVSMMLVGSTIAIIAQPKGIITSNDHRKNKKKKYWKIQ